MAETVKKAKSPAIKPTQPGIKAVADRKKPAAEKAPAPKKATAAKKAPAVSKSKKAVGTTSKIHLLPATHEQIALLAHRYWTERGFQHGSHEEDWYRAEQELRGKAS